MTTAVDPIKIGGLREFQAALRQMDGETQKRLRVVLNTAADIDVAAAARRVPTRSGRARASIRAQSSQREAKVVGGSKKVPYYGWLDFGGRIGRNQKTRRPFLQAGRFVYPAFVANRDAIYQALADGLADLARDAGLDVS